MDCNFFVLKDKAQSIEIERFHICTWEFRDNSALLELGCEINSSLFFKSADIESLELKFYIPWIEKKCEVLDLYENLKDPGNCRFIFNDSVLSSIFLDEGQNKKGASICETNVRRSLAEG